MAGLAWIGISLDFPLLNDLIISLISSTVQSCITMEFLVRLDMKVRNDGSGSTRMPVPCMVIELLSNGDKVVIKCVRNPTVVEDDLTVNYKCW